MDSLVDGLTWSSLKPEEQPIRGSLALQLLNVLAFVGVVISNAMSRIGDPHPTLISPAGYTFAIWGVIYLGVAAFVLYQLFPSQRRNPIIVRRISVWFILSCVCNVTWILLFPNGYLGASAGVIVAFLLTLLVAYYRIGVGRRPGHEVSAQEYLCVHLPFSLYTAWLCVATAVNIALALQAEAGWHGEPWTEEGWAILVMAVLSLVTLIILATRLDAPFGAVVSWGLFGIANNQGDVPPVFMAACVLGALLALVSVVALGAKLFLWGKDRARHQPYKGEALNLQEGQSQD